ncbi:hypothetical protein [Phytoactinopolyspora endophytica]|uniref:hypothetical protein n=1 Tax=Phytoactinopolyspora endophytica TaxID=1642495 RepID=UPI00101D965A|nr:hypothetical protein [Phytoactinopolyspora endophytica]
MDPHSGEPRPEPTADSGIPTKPTTATTTAATTKAAGSNQDEAGAAAHTTEAASSTEAARGRIGPTFPSWRLRGVLALACVILIASVTIWAGPHVFFVVVLLAQAVYVVIRPDSHATTALLASSAAVIVFADVELSAWLMPAVLGFHVAHLVAALAAVAPWDTDLEHAALRPALRRFVAVQGASQALVLLALLVSP